MMNNPALVSEFRPLWHYTLAAYLILSTALYLLATRFIKPIRPWRIGWQGLALVALLIVLYFGVGATVFFKDIDRALNPPAITPTPTPVPGVPVPLMRRVVVPAEPVEPPVQEPTIEPPEEPSDQ